MQPLQKREATNIHATTLIIRFMTTSCRAIKQNECQVGIYNNKLKRLYFL